MNDSSLGERQPVTGTGGPSDFCTTQWSTILAAGQVDYTRAAGALERLCQRYWYPIYAFIRRRGVAWPEAEDLTQAFFAHLLKKDTLSKVDPNRGRFRAFLASSLTNFLKGEWDYRTALRRGGKQQVVSLDTVAAEELYEREAAGALTAELLFERRWAITLLEEVLRRLKQEYILAGKGMQFAVLEPALSSAVPPGFYTRCAAELALTENATKVALHRLRRRFGEVLRSEIAHTVAGPEEIEDEIRYLFSIISN
jgi:DNA-directed RNA polymerase specialized sigma24 family protein